MKSAAAATCMILFLVSSAPCAEKYSIGLLVLDHVTRKPLGNVTVRVLGVESAHVTDEQGRAEIGGIAPGQYKIELSHVGYRRVTKDISVVDRDVSGPAVFLEQIQNDPRLEIQPAGPGVLIGGALWVSQ